VYKHGEILFMLLSINILFFLFFWSGIGGEFPSGTPLVNRMETAALVELSAEPIVPLAQSPTCCHQRKGIAKRRVEARPLALFCSEEPLYQQQPPRERFAALLPLASTQAVPRYLSLQVYRL
jgi:hypothetical protein